MFTSTLFCLEKCQKLFWMELEVYNLSSKEQQCIACFVLWFANRCHDFYHKMVRWMFKIQCIKSLLKSLLITHFLLVPMVLSTQEQGTSGTRYPKNQEPMVLGTPGTRNQWYSVPQEPETSGTRYPKNQEPVVLGTPETSNQWYSVPQN